MTPSTSSTTASAPEPTGGRTASLPVVILAIALHRGEAHLHPGFHFDQGLFDAAIQASRTTSIAQAVIFGDWQPLIRLEWPELTE
jgi:hypothetical protein